MIFRGGHSIFPRWGSDRALAAVSIGPRRHLPAVRDFGILPEIPFGSFAAFACEVIADYLKNDRVRGDEVTNRPVTTVNEPIGTENVPELIERRAIEAYVFWHVISLFADDVRDLRVHSRTFPQFAQGCFVCGALGSLCRRVERQVVDHDAQIRDTIRKPHNLRQHWRAAKYVQLQSG